MERPNIITFVGESGTGKSTLMHSLVDKDDRFRILPSITTRARRPSDLAREYIYLSIEEHAKLAAIPGRLLWSVKAGNKDDQYAKDVLDIMDALTDDKDEDDGGHVYLHGLIPDAAKWLEHRYGSEVVKTVLLQSPGQEELRRRMIGRGDAPEKIEERLAKEKEANWAGQVADLEGLVVVTCQDLLDRQNTIYELAGLAIR